MQIGIGCDPAGYELKLWLVERLRSAGHDVDDVGCHSLEPADYPDYARLVGRGVVDGRFERGILICGTGQGMAMAANKIRGVRAALCMNPLHAIMSREHNNANVLCFGAWVFGRGDVASICDAWLFGKYGGGAIHQARIEKMDAAALE
jgi:ribose 5-phosphate isomerase B